MIRHVWTIALGLPLVAGVTMAAAVVEMKPPAVEFETEATTRGDVEETVSAFGRLQPRDYVDVGAQASGQLLRLHAREGDIVRKGQLLAEIDPSMQQALVEANRAEIAELEAQSLELKLREQFALQRATREEKLMHTAATSADKRDEMRMEAAAAAAQVKVIDAKIHAARATLRSNEAQLGYTRIYAPMDGTVVSVEARPGQTLVATYQTVQLLRIADLSVMTVWTQIAEADVPKLRAGMPVWFTTLGHEGRKWEARVRAILPGPYRVDGKENSKPGGNAVVFYTALFDVPNAGNELRPDMSAQTFFVTQQARNVLSIPVSAAAPVAGSADRASVRVLSSDGTPQTRTIRMGVRTRFKAEVVEGLLEGERVITGEKLQEDGMKIRFVL